MPLTCGPVANPPALGGTSTTGLCALLAMFHLMLRAFLGARVTKLRTRVADRRCELTAARHIACGQAADLRAVDIQLDAACQFLDVLFCQT